MQSFEAFDAQALYGQMADALVENGFGVFHHALPQTWCLTLLNEARHAELVPAGVGRGVGHQNNLKVRSDTIAWIEPNTTVQTDWLHWCEGLRLTLNRSLMMGLRSLESHFACYQVGDFYALHRDAFIDAFVDSSVGTNNRRVSLVAYLNANWDASHGGELVLYGSDSRECCRVLPQQGTVVLFLSEQFPHEVLPAQRERYSIAAWFA